MHMPDSAERISDEPSIAGNIAVDGAPSPLAASPVYDLSQLPWSRHLPENGIGSYQEHEAHLDLFFR